MKKSVIVIAGFLAVLGLTACQGIGKKNIVVAADTIYSELLTEDVITEFQKQSHGIKVKFEYGSSVDMKRKIENGEAVDVFLSANASEMSSLNDKALIAPDSLTPLWNNNIVLVTPNTAAVSGLENITDYERIAISSPDKTQSGWDAREALKESGLWDQVKTKVVHGTSDLEVLNFVVNGETEAGIMYASTAASAADKVTVAGPITGETSKGAVLSAAIVSASKNGKQAQTFIDFLKGDSVQQIFSDAGFTAVEE